MKTETLQKTKVYETGYFRFPEKFMRICCKMTPSTVIQHTLSDHAGHELASYLSKRFHFNIQYIRTDENGNAVFFFSDKQK